MCLPMLAAAPAAIAAASTPLSIMSGAVSALGAVAQANAQNAASAANAQSASLAAQSKYDDQQRRFVFNSRSLQQEGYKAEMEKREAAGTAVASAGSSGVGGISVGSILAAVNQQGAENQARVRTKQDDLQSSYTSDVKTIEAEARNRTASVQPANPMNLGLNILSSFVPKG